LVSTIIFLEILFRNGDLLSDTVIIKSRHQNLGEFIQSSSHGGILYLFGQSLDNGACEGEIRSTFVSSESGKGSLVLSSRNSSPSGSRRRKFSLDVVPVVHFAYFRDSSHSESSL